MGASMADIINILIAVDCETLAQQSLSTDSDHPTSIAENLVYAIVRQSNALSGQGGANLDVSARTGDIIRWRETSLSLNTEYQPIAYRFHVSQGAELLKDLGPETVEVTTPLPNPEDLLHPGTQTIKSYFWEAEVRNSGRATYQFSFMIVDRDSNVKGYCTWDPYITIKS
jgi:hypothetical protein